MPKRKNKQATSKATAILDNDDASDEPSPTWNKEAKALHDAIKSGKFDDIGNNDDDDDEADAFVEADIDEQVDSNTKEQDDDDDDSEQEIEDDDSEQEDDDEEDSEMEANDQPVPEKKVSPITTKVIKQKNAKHDKPKESADTLPELVVDASSSSDEDDEETIDKKVKNDNSDASKIVANNKASLHALQVVVQQLQDEKSNWPWPETFAITSSDPLPFGKSSSSMEPIDIHDDLKREVAFYDMARDAVLQARQLCEDNNIPFKRPEDFFAEMVKTDDHMAKIKDRLIFENKKIDAVAQRKSRKEQALRAKETQANKAMEKAKRKKQNIQDVHEYAEQAKANRDGGPNLRRQRANEKYGHGGPRPRFKQNDPKALNDFSDFNPRGSNFPGGQKTKRSFKGTSGAKRPGKRARDSKRQKR